MFFLASTPYVIEFLYLGPNICPHSVTFSDSASFTNSFGIWTLGKTGGENAIGIRNASLCASVGSYFWDAARAYCPSDIQEAVELNRMCPPPNVSLHPYCATLCTNNDAWLLMGMDVNSSRKYNFMWDVCSANAAIGSRIAAVAAISKDLCSQPLAEANKDALCSFGTGPTMAERQACSVAMQALFQADDCSGGKVADVDTCQKVCHWHEGSEPFRTTLIKRVVWFQKYSALGLGVIMTFTLCQAVYTFYLIAYRVWREKRGEEVAWDSDE